ncbi:MAG: indoleamine 2,3-dioxygenase, partial [Chlamydiales bacterium]|nr:indoleamine 2,3-dioxygenase [Chlamydiales bacterium]
MQKLPRGFLPEHDPLITLPQAFSAWVEAANTLPKLLVAGIVKSTIEHLPEF